jgi:hypothetical protein
MLMHERRSELLRTCGSSDGVDCFHRGTLHSRREFTPGADRDFDFAKLDPPRRCRQMGRVAISVA